MTSSGPGGHQPGPVPPLPAPPARSGAFDLRRLGVPDLGMPVAAVLYLVLACLPWASVDFFAGRFTVSGFRFSGLVTVTLVLLLAAAVWALLPAVTVVRLQFPRHVVTGGLAALAVLMTLITWLRSLDYGFAAPAFLGLLVTLAAVALAAVGLLPELRGTAGRPGSGAPGQPPAPAAGPAYGRPGWQPPQGVRPAGQPPVPAPPGNGLPAATPPVAAPPVYTPPPPTAPPAPQPAPPSGPAAPRPSDEEAGFWSRPRPGDPGAQSGPDAG
ncbi:hypothetical protein [Modestobacter sp. NPDC049651]|uniref:hypothetical protein n=1 Tax=unclassified Modestobacter TaxID=2643866 RepID=UPI0033E9F5C4